MFVNAYIAFLAKHPVLGFFSGVGGYFVTYIDTINELLKFASLGLGIIVAILTIYAKVLEIKNRKK